MAQELALGAVDGPALHVRVLPLEAALKTQVGHHLRTKKKKNKKESNQFHLSHFYLKIILQGFSVLFSCELISNLLRERSFIKYDFLPFQLADSFSFLFNSIHKIIVFM